MVKTSVWTFLVVAILLCCTSEIAVASSTMDSIAESYVKLVLKVWVYDLDYVDYYNGPSEWMPTLRNGRRGSEFPFDEFNKEVQNLIERLKEVNQSDFQSMEKLRYAYLIKSLLAAKAKIDLLAGVKMSFDEESKALYDAVAPSHDKEYYDKILMKFNAALPGEGDIYLRYWTFCRSFMVPQDKWDVVCMAAMAECRRRTLQHIDLPKNEHTDVKFVSGKVGGGYNWYKGNSYSLIQYNIIETGLHVDYAIHLASHEGYPGHHVYMTLLDKHMAAERNWIEYSVSLLYSPQAFIAEGLAQYGTDLAFPYDERVEFERTVLFPLAELDPSKADKYHEVEKLREALNPVLVEVARQYLDGNMSRDEAIAMLNKYGLAASQEDESMINFIEKHRSYIINYFLGQDTVEKYIEKNGGTDINVEKRWSIFHTLLSTPQIPSVMMEACE